MTSSLASLTTVCGVGAGFNAAILFADRADVLDHVNWVLVIGGVVLLLTISGVMLARHRRLEWGFAAPRDCRLSIEAVLAPFVVFVLTAALLQAVADWWTGGATQTTVESEPDLVQQTVISNLALLAGVAVCYAAGRHLVGTHDRGFVLGDRRYGRHLVEAVVVVLVALALCQLAANLTAWLIEAFWPEFEFDEHRVIETLRDPSRPGWLLPLLWLGTTLITPVAEEMFFRGLLQTALTRVLRKRGYAIVIAGLLFGLAHSQQPQVVPAIALFGIMLGVLYERTGSLVGPIIAHALFNAKTLLWETLGGAAA